MGGSFDAPVLADRDHLEQVLDNVAHRNAGSPSQDLLTDAGNRALMVRFLKSIDSTKPFFQGP